LVSLKVESVLEETTAEVRLAAFDISLCGKKMQLKGCLDDNLSHQ